MLYSDYHSLLQEGIDFGFDSGLVIGEYIGRCTANDFVPLPLTVTSPMYDRDAVISMVPADRQLSIGSLITCKDQNFGYGAASAEIVSAYLMDAERSDVVDSQGVPKRDYKFKKDYVVVQSSDYNDYISRFRAGSGLWGNFTHKEDQPNAPTPHIKSNAFISAIPDIKTFTAPEKDALWRSVSHFSPLERFLKLYHLLELYFDLQLVEQIRVIGNDLKDIGKLLNSYNGDKEFDRLLKVVKPHCPEISFFERVLADAFSNPAYHDQWREILFEYSKESNPYKDQAHVIMNALMSGFTDAE